MVDDEAHDARAEGEHPAPKVARALEDGAQARCERPRLQALGAGGVAWGGLSKRNGAEQCFDQQPVRVPHSLQPTTHRASG